MSNNTFPFGAPELALRGVGNFSDGVATFTINGHSDTLTLDDIQLLKMWCISFILMHASCDNDRFKDLLDKGYLTNPSVDKKQEEPDDEARRKAVDLSITLSNLACLESTKEGKAAFNKASHLVTEELVKD